MIEEDFHIPHPRRSLRRIREGGNPVPQGVGRHLPDPGLVGIEGIQDPVVVRAQSAQRDLHLLSRAIGKRDFVGLFVQAGGHISSHMKSTFQESIRRRFRKVCSI